MDAYYSDSGCWLSGDSYQPSPSSKPASYFTSGDYCVFDETTTVGIFSNTGTLHQSFPGDSLCSTVTCGPSVCSSAGLWRGSTPERRLPDSQKQILSKPASLFGVCTQCVSSASNSHINTNTFTAPGFGFDEIMDTLCDTFSGSATDVDIFSTESVCRKQQLFDNPRKTLVSLATTNSYITNDHGFITPQVGVGIGGNIGDSSLVDLLRNNDDDNEMIISSYAFHDASMGGNMYGNGNSAAQNLKHSSLFADLQQQQMMGFSDTSTADADQFDFIVSSCKMASLPSNNLPKYSSLTAAAVASQTNSSGASTASGWPLHNGLLRMSNAPSLRVRNVPVTRIGSLLQHSIQNATHVHGPGHKARSHSGNCTSIAAAGSSGVGQRVGRLRSSTSSSRLTDVRGGRPGPPNQTHLDDHRYTMKMFPTGPPQSRCHLSLPKSSSTSRLSGCGGNTSILEMFLRSSRQMDPNKGSNAALAAEGLGNLHLSHYGLADNVEDEDKVDDDQSGTLLMQLLTGKMDQHDVNRERQREISDRCNRNVMTPICQQEPPAVAVVQHEQQSTHCLSGGVPDDDSTLKTVTSIDSLLVDDLGFLNDQQSIELLDDFDAGEGLWMTTSIDVLEDMSISDDLDEILREQNRQDFLLLQHYATEHQP